MISRAARDAISGAIQIDHENPHFQKWYGKHYDDVVIRIDLRRNVRATIPHEFLVIYRQGRKPFRIDRRGDPYVPAQALTQLGCPAHDTIEPLDENALGGTYVAASMRCRAKEGGELYVDDLLRLFLLLPMMRLRVAILFGYVLVRDADVTLNLC